MPRGIVRPATAWAMRVRRVGGSGQAAGGKIDELGTFGKGVVMEIATIKAVLLWSGMLNLALLILSISCDSSYYSELALTSVVSVHKIPALSVCSSVIPGL